jgi:formate hydrogenlyase subunit 3/multisubunit Na+/H+ antiporter MnhD subunit
LSTADAWIVWVVLAPLIGAVTAFVVGRSAGLPIAIATCAGVVASIAGLIRQVVLHGPARYAIGGWGAPLGIEFYADGLSIIMLLMTSVVNAGITVYSLGYFSNGHRDRIHEGNLSDRTGDAFWPLWLFAWGSLNAVFLTGDLFNLYVSLELLMLSGVALIGLARHQDAVSAAFRYLLASSVGSLLYLLGVALIYGTYGTVDCLSLARVAVPSPATFWAIALLTTGLMMKTALFPLHFWLPPAHGNAPAPVSAFLSALVVKASFYSILRLWFFVFPEIITPTAGLLLGGAGAAAVIYGSVQTLRQIRLKLLVAYSTVAQIGYLFLVFALTREPDIAAQAWSGSVYYALSHACAKASMFLAVGAIVYAVGSDNIDELDGIGRQLPMSVFAFGLAGASLMGLPPSGGFVGKWMLLRAGIDAGLWWVAAVILTGGLLAALYIFPFLNRALSSAGKARSIRRVPRVMQWMAMTLAVVTVLLGLFAKEPLEILETGAPFKVSVLERSAP